MIQGYFTTANLSACLARLVNQYGILDADHDFAADPNDAASRDYYNSEWPHSMGDGFSTPVEQCDQTGVYLFNLQLTQAQVDSLPSTDNPNFNFQYEGELDGEGVELPPPTYMVEYSPGVFTARTICSQ